MRYKEALKIQHKANICPFCNEKSEYIFENNKYFYVTPARAPYVKNHILIIPYRHVAFFQELTHDEIEDMIQLMEKWTKKLHKHHKNITMLLRDGLVSPTVGKSVLHLHFHLVPDCAISPQNGIDENREFYEDGVFEKVIKDMKKRLKLK